MDKKEETADAVAAGDDGIRVMEGQEEEEGKEDTAVGGEQSFVQVCL